MAWTQPDVDALKNAIKRGVRSVTMPDGRNVTYQSTEQMMAILQAMEAEVSTAGGSTSEGRSTLAVFSRE